MLLYRIEVVYSSNINNLKDHEAIKEMFYAPMKTIVTFSIVAVVIILLFASGHIHDNQQMYAVNTGNVGHLYEGGIPGYPYFGGYPNYGGYPYITGYGHHYDTGGDHSYGYGYGGYPYNGDHSYNHDYGGYTFFHHHHHHHHHTH